MQHPKHPSTKRGCNAHACPDASTVVRPRAASGTVRAVAVLGLFFCLAACSPRFDWRDYQDPDGFSATFPGKVQSATRPIDLDGLAVTMSMHAARVDETAFVIGSVTLPDGDPAALAKAEDAVARGLVRNIAGTISKDEAAPIKSQTAGLPATPARALEVAGSANGQPMRMVARIAGHGNHVYQIMVVGPAREFAQAATQEAIDSFVGSVRLQ